jgi:hypothetical protein
MHSLARAQRAQWNGCVCVCGGSDERRLATGWPEPLAKMPKRHSIVRVCRSYVANRSELPTWRTRQAIQCAVRIRVRPGTRKPCVCRTRTRKGAHEARVTLFGPSSSVPDLPGTYRTYRSSSRSRAPLARSRWSESERSPASLTTTGVCHLHSLPFSDAAIFSP